MPTTWLSTGLPDSETGMMFTCATAVVVAADTARVCPYVLQKI